MLGLCLTENIVVFSTILLVIMFYIKNQPQWGHKGNLNKFSKAETGHFHTGQSISMQNAIELDINNKNIIKESYILKSFGKPHTHFELFLGERRNQNEK